MNHAVNIEIIYLRIMRTKILVEPGQRKQIANLLGCCEHSVGRALNGKRTSPLAERIRTIAIRDFRGVPQADSKVTIK